MPCGWEGNCRSGVALVMRHRLQWFIHLRAYGLLKADESTPPTFLVGYDTLYLYPHVTSAMILSMILSHEHIRLFTF